MENGYSGRFSNGLDHPLDKSLGSPMGVNWGGGISGTSGRPRIRRTAGWRLNRLICRLECLVRIPPRHRWRRLDDD